jgi:RsiW-degrading membrane proteinase PrsW (M82 family)
MDNLTVILFLCVCIPILPALTLLPDRRSRLFLGYLLVGMAVCLIAAWVNTLLLALSGGDRLYVTTSFTPIAEELIKTLPVLYFALCFSDDRDTLLSLSLAVGLGFALLENTTILVQNVENVTIPWAVARGFGAALMHAACTAMVGLGISYVRKRRKLFYCGTFSLLIAAVSFHAIFNLLVQSAHRWLAFVWSALIFVPQLVSAVSRKIKNRERSS